MPDMNSLKHQLTTIISASPADSATKEGLLLRVEVAQTAEGLKALIPEINRLAAPLKSQSDAIIDEINSQLGIMRLSNRAVYVIKDRTEWGPSGLIEFWTSATDAQEYLMRKGVRVITYSQNEDGSPKKTNHFEHWRKSSAADYYCGEDYIPNGPPKYAGRFNMWKGWGIEPAMGDKHGIFLELVRKFLCNGNEAYSEYFLSWLAHMVQKPTERPGTAIVIISQEGAGKGTLVEVLAAMIGAHNCSGDISNKDLTGGFNSKLVYKLLVNLNEASFSGNHEQVEVMKKMITDPTIRCERKGYEAFDVWNYIRMLITTNNTNWGRVSTRDRRYLILEPNEVSPTREFFEQLRTEMFEEGGVKNLFRYLLDRDISDWVPQTLPERTTGIDTLEESMGRNSCLKFAYELAGFGYIESGVSDLIRCGETVSFRNLFASYLAFCNQDRRMHAEAKNKFSTYFQGVLGAHTYKRANVVHVTLPSQLELRRAVADQLRNWTIPWSERFGTIEEESSVLSFDKARAEKLSKFTALDGQERQRA